MKKKIAFLDRDGTINIEKNYLYEIDKFEFVPGVIEGLKMLEKNNFLLVVVTNQSGIARGYYDEEDYIKLTNWMRNDLKRRGVDIKKCFYCPHHPEAKVKKYQTICNCRKPETKLFHKAITELSVEYDLDIENSVAIGDKERDLKICEELNIKGYLIARHASAKSKKENNIYFVNDLLEAVKCICGEKS